MYRVGADQLGFTTGGTGRVTVSNTQTYIIPTTTSTSTTTGALRVGGGVGIGGNLNVGGNLLVTGSNNIGQIAGLNTRLGFEALNSINTTADGNNTGIGY
jgi:hypothetical protein